MNGYTLRKKGIRSQKSIILEMIMHGFTTDEIVEFTGYKIFTVKTVYCDFNTEVLFYKHKHTHIQLQERKKLKAAMFSPDEMDYGYTGQQKYIWGELSEQERILIK